MSCRLILIFAVTVRYCLRDFLQILRRDACRFIFDAFAADAFFAA